MTYREQAQDIVEDGGAGVELAGALVALGLSDVAQALRDLGTADAATSMGAIEVLSVKVGEAGNNIAGGLESLAESHRQK